MDTKTAEPLDRSTATDTPHDSSRLSQSDIEKNAEARGSLSASPDAPPASPRQVHGFVWVLVVAGTLSSIFIYALDNTIVADITPNIVNAFGHVEELSWVSVGFILGGCSIVLPIAKLYNRFDAKYLYIMFYVIFLAGSALCGATPNMDGMTVGRVLAGMGGNGMYMGVLTLLSVNTNDRERPAYLSLVGLFWGIGIVLGPVIGGAFAQSSATWRWAFYINLIIGGVFSPVYIFLLPRFDPSPNTKFIDRFKNLDYIGSVLIVGALVSGIMAINFGGNLYAWGSGQIIALFVVSGVLFIIFGLQQGLEVLTDHANRIFPAHLIRNKDVVLLFAACSAINTSGFIPIYYIPLFFSFTHGDDPIKAAVRLLPLIFLMVFFIVLNGNLMSKFGYFQPWYVAGGALTIIGGVLMSRITADTTPSTIYGYEVLLGIGVGCFIQASFSVVQGLLPPEEMGNGLGMMLISQLGGITIGLAIAGAVFTNVATNALTDVLPNVARSQLQAALAGTSNSYFLSLPDNVRSEALQVLISSMRKVFIPVYVGGAVALVCACLMTPKKLFLQAAAGGG